MTEVLTLARMAGRLGVAQDWLREQAEAGKVPGLKARRRWLFNPIAVAEALAILAARPVPSRVRESSDGE